MVEISEKLRSAANDPAFNKVFDNDEGQPNKVANRMQLEKLKQGDKSEVKQETPKVNTSKVKTPNNFGHPFNVGLASMSDERIDRIHTILDEGDESQKK